MLTGIRFFTPTLFYYSKLQANLNFGKKMYRVVTDMLYKMATLLIPFALTKIPNSNECLLEFLMSIKCLYIPSVCEVGGHVVGTYHAGCS